MILEQIEPFEPEDDVCKAIAEVLDVAFTAVTYSATGDPETFIRCNLCGEFDDHTESCPIPAIIKWENGD